jgi:hypothetical protein
MLPLVVTASLVGPFLTEVEAADFASGREFQTAIHARIGLNWSDNPIRSGLQNLSRAKKVAIFLDRRVPPQTLMEFQSDSAPLWAVVDGLARTQSLDWSIVQNVVYIGPKGPGTRLNSLSDLARKQLATIPASRRAAMLKSGPLEWPRLSQPRELVRQLAAEAGLTVSNPEAISHDLWPEVELPKMPWVDRATLLLNNFDLMLQFRADGRAVNLIPIPQTESFERVHRLPTGSRLRVSDRPDALKESSIKRDRRGLVVSGTFAEHDMVFKWILSHSGPTRPDKTVGAKPSQVYDLRIDNQPVGGVIKSLAQKLGWTPQVSAAASQKLGERISFRVTGATAEQLIEAAVKPAGLAYRLNGQVLQIFTAEEAK